MPKQFIEEDFTNKSFNFKIWQKLLAHFKKYRWRFIILCFLNIILALNEAVIPLLNRFAVDFFALKEFKNADLIIFIIIYLVILLISSGLTTLFIYISGKIEANFSHDLREKAFLKLTKLNLSYYDKTPTGWLLSRLSSDINDLAEVSSFSFADLVWCIAAIGFSFGIMLYTSVKLTLIFLIIIPLIAFLTFYFEKKILNAYRLVRKQKSELTHSFNEGINGIGEAKIMAFEDYQIKSFKESSHKLSAISLKAIHLNALYRPLVNLISSSALAFIIWLGGNLIYSKQISFGIILMFTNYIYNFFEPLNALTMIMQGVQNAQAGGERIMQLLEEKACEKSEKNKRSDFDLDNFTGDINFKNIYFSYKKDEPLLENFNLLVRGGERVALVGETGAGKSTIVNLLCRFYEIDSGTILLDGIDIKNKSLFWLRKQIGYVLQSPQLFDGSILDNIRYGNPNASYEEVVEAAKVVNAHQFIMQLDKGYDSSVGENGALLSTGQKQLISFARAILKKPAIFILDEATSTIDSETEKIIQEAIDKTFKNKTTLIVAHRLSTIINADKIVVIKDGKIIEIGKHLELLKLNGYYANLYRQQLGQS